MTNNKSRERIHYLRYSLEPGYVGGLIDVFPAIVLPDNQYTSLVNRLSSKNRNQCIFSSEASAERVFWINNICISVNKYDNDHDYMIVTGKRTLDIEDFAKKHNLPFELTKVYTSMGSCLHDE